MAAKTVKADYMEQVLPEYNGNPHRHTIKGKGTLRRNTGSIACPVCCMIIINPLRSTWISKTVYPYA